MKTSPVKPELLTAQEVAALLGIGVRSLARHVQRGLLPRPLRIGTRTLRYSRQAVMAWVADQAGRATR